MTESQHIRASLLLLAGFIVAGLALEGMIGLRIEGWVDDAVRREFLRLGHAHGAVLAGANLGVAWAMRAVGTPAAWATRIRSALCLSAPTVGLGFAGGGLWHGPSDPGPLILLVPAGALLAIASVAAVAVLPSADSDHTPGSPS